MTTSKSDTESSADKGDVIRLWSGPAPGTESWTHDEVEVTDPETGTLMIKGVVVPTLTPVLPAAGTGNGSAVVVAPGGAFVALAWEHEGLSMAEWFASRGVAAFVLKYRLGPEPDPETAAATMADAPDPAQPESYLDWLKALVSDTAKICAADGEQAVRIVRARASEWDVDPSRIGVVGFSAGGTVALWAAVTDDATARPDFVVNVYGAFLDRDVPDDAPPCFTVVAADDPIAEWPLEAAHRWRQAKRPIEMHVYEQGGHGFGLRAQELPVDSWTDRLEDWLKIRLLLP